MIINSKYKFIFIHIPKTAGSSLMNALEKIEGNEPLLVSRKTKHESYIELKKKIKLRLFIRNVVNLFSKTSAKLYEYDILNYKVIAVHRNPWERFKSLYKYLYTIDYENISQKRISFSEFVDLLNQPNSMFRNLYSLKSQFSYIDEVDFNNLELILFDNLKKQNSLILIDGKLEIILPKKNISSEDKIPNGLFKIEKKHKNVVDNYFIKDIEFFNSNM